jgi:C4-dicarboxylate-specific signal transduction histidine kinase
LGDGWSQGVHPDDIERCLDTYLSAVQNRSSFSMEYRLRRGDGGYGWLADSGVPRLAPNGELLGYIGTCFDITERKHVKEELQQANEQLVQRVAERTAELSATIASLKDEIDQRIRMGQALQAETAERLNVQSELREKELLLLHQSRLAAMGEMIGNIAHQWRQPLNMLGLLAQELPITYRKGEFNTEYLEANVKRMLETINFMSKTIDDFRNFFRPDKEKTDFRIVEMIDKTISLLEGSLKAQQIRTAVVAASDPVVNGYPNEFSQVLLNIMINARDAFATQNVADPTITIEIGGEEGRCVVTITDNAGGIPEEIIDKIFDPYFTTKGPDKGTGVGLYMSKTIVEKNMGGTLSACNVDGGAQFRIEV